MPLKIGEMRVSNSIEKLTHVVDGNSPLNIVSLKDAQQDFIVEISGEGECDIDLTISDHSKVNLFFINTGQNLKLKETITLKRDSELNISYADFNDAQLERDANFIFEKEGAVCHLKSAVLVQSDKRIKYNFDHVARNTYGDMENFAVTFDEGSLVMHAAGHIGKNAALSETHQSTRVLNYNSTKKAQVFPELIIENNDVKASHAESSGQVNSDHLYYMQSRGLSTGDAVRLIVKGYLSSILDAIKDEELHDKLMLEIDQKVERVCSM